MGTALRGAKTTCEPCCGSPINLGTALRDAKTRWDPCCGRYMDLGTALGTWACARFHPPSHGLPAASAREEAFATLALGGGRLRDHESNYIRILFPADTLGTQLDRPGFHHRYLVSESSPCSAVAHGTSQSSCLESVTGTSQASCLEGVTGSQGGKDIDK